MTLIPIEVECYSGYRSDEYPVSFYWDNVKYEIKEVTDHWYQADPSPELPVADYYKVSTMGNMKYILKHELLSDQWFLVSPDGPVFRISYN